MILCFSFLIIGCSDIENDVSDDELENELNSVASDELETYANIELDEEKSSLSGDAGKKFDFYKLTDGRRVNIDYNFVRKSRAVFDSRFKFISTLDCTATCNELNFCYNGNNLCQGTVLLLGDNYGYSMNDDVKSYISNQQNKNYESGINACEVMYSDECVEIEVYLGGEWVLDNSLKCGSSVSEDYDSLRIYRAVCLGLVDADTSPTTVANVILNN